MKNVVYFFFFLICNVSSLFAAEEHDFFGKHLIISYSECDRKALGDLQSLIAVMNEAVQASGATILQSAQHIFEPNGLTMVFLLSESHASIHTYPEYGACFVDLFTCGNNCSSEAFDKVLTAYLQPKQVSKRILIRHHDMEDLN